MLVLVVHVSPRECIPRVGTSLWALYLSGRNVDNFKDVFDSLVSCLEMANHKVC